MANNDFKLSPENIKMLGKVIDEAKTLLSQQVEILEKVLQAEDEIAKVRIGHLNQYFDAYHAKLDSVASKTSTLDEHFLVLDHQADRFISKKSSGTGPSSSENPSGGTSSPKKEVKVSNDNGASLDEEDMPGVSDEEIAKSKEAKQHIKDFLQHISEYTDKIDPHVLETYDLAASTKAIEKLAKQTDTYKNSVLELQNLRNNEEDQENRILAIKLKSQQAAIDAEIASQNYLNDLNAEIAYASGKYEQDAIDEINAREQQIAAAEKLASEKEVAAAALKYREQLEAKARKKNNGVLEAADALRIKKEYTEKLKNDLQNLDKVTKERQKREAKEQAKKNRAEVTKAVSGPLDKENNLVSRIKTLNDIGRDGNGDRSARDGFLVALTAVSDLATQLERKIDDIASFKGDIDTRLQGSNLEKSMGSYWDQLVKDMTSVGAINPFFKQQTFANNIKDLVNRGISFDLKQRAFLMTIQSKIATTFDAADGTLLRLIRIQQQDTTAGRLGMESALNAFLNEMYETSEYLSTVAKSVRSSLEEMQALAEGDIGTEIEYQVQKWLGSLYSVGMSQSATQSIADALGKIASGQLDGLTNGGAGNLLIMAANDAGIPIADILTNGLSSEDTNKLLQSAVNYLSDLAESAEDNKVVQQQLAAVFGVRASDLKAATNLASSSGFNSVYSDNLTYSGMIDRLYSMAGSMASRSSMAEMMTNLWENGQYTMAGSMASNPVSYFIYKMAKVVDDAAGGIDLPFVNAMGFGVDLNTTVSDLMRVAAVGTGLLGSLGQLIPGLGNSFRGRAMLDQLGIKSASKLTISARGGSSATGVGAAGGTVSESGGAFVGNASGSDLRDSTIQESKDSKKQLMIEAKEEEEDNGVETLNQSVMQIYELLNEVTTGDKTFRVRVESYGLTRNGSSLSNSLGGVSGAAGASSGSGGSGSSDGGLSSALGGGLNSGFSGSVDFGSWTAV